MTSADVTFPYFSKIKFPINEGAPCPIWEPTGKLGLGGAKPAGAGGEAWPRPCCLPPLPLLLWLHEATANPGPHHLFFGQSGGGAQRGPHTLLPSDYRLGIHQPPDLCLPCSWALASPPHIWEKSELLAGTSFTQSPYPCPGVTADMNVGCFH